MNPIPQVPLTPLEVAERIERISSILIEPCSQSPNGKLPSLGRIRQCTDKLRSLLFPQYYALRTSPFNLRFTVSKLMAELYDELSAEATLALQVNDTKTQESVLLEQARQAVFNLLENLPAIREVLESDIEAVMSHDPAAQSRTEILIAYPGFEALTVYRLAHFLYKQNIPLIPRIMTEMVHSRTGIDIHPAAVIGSYCSIDHGTGLIIGETCHLGHHVNLYHNVTLGARSVSRNFTGKKRHPTLGDRVTIYPGATILGDIMVGEDSIIGGNVYLLKSCPPKSKIYAEPPKMIFKVDED